MHEKGFFKNMEARHPRLSLMFTAEGGCATLESNFHIFTEMWKDFFYRLLKKIQIQGV